MNTRILAFSVCLFLAISQANAAVIISHTGTTDPETEGWTLKLGYNAGVPGVGVTHLGEPAIKVIDPHGTSGRWAYYTNETLALSAFTDPTGWTVSWRLSTEELKLEGLSSDECAFTIMSGVRYMQFRYYAAADGIGPCEIWCVTGTPHLITTIAKTADRAFGWHNFAVSYNPTTTKYSFFYDGVLVEESATLGRAETTSAGRISWGGFGGGNYDARDVISYWNSVKLETGPYTGIAQCGDLNHPYPVGDFSQDCVVNFKDLAFMVAEWLDCTDPTCD